MNDDLEPASVPASDGTGTDAAVRVERPGIALVHEGEYIGPDPQSTAFLGPVVGAQVTGVGSIGGSDDSSEPTEVHYWFPVEIEVVGAVDDSVADLVVARVFDELQREMASRQ